MIDIRKTSPRLKSVRFFVAPYSERCFNWANFHGSLVTILHWFPAISIESV